MNNINLEEILKEEEQKEMVAFFNKHEDCSGHTLAQGEINGLWYFGKQLDIKGRKIDSVVLEDGKVLINLKMQYPNKKAYEAKVLEAKNAIEEYGFRVQKSLLTPENFWSKEGINLYIKCSCVGLSPSTSIWKNYENLLRATYTTTLTTLNTQTTLTTQSPKLSILLEKKNDGSLLDLIDGVQNHFMDVFYPTLTTLTSCYIIATYCYQLFDSIGYLFLCSDSGTGKTKWANIIQYLSFNSINATNTSESAMFRIVEQSKGTLFIDDYEKVEENKKNAIDQLLKVGYKKGGKTCRSEKVGDNFVPVFFDVFCPKVITNTEGLDSITYSRCIPLHLLKTLSTKGALNPKSSDGYWQQIRDCCYFWVMLNWKQVKKNYDELQVEGLNNRDLELVKPLLAVAKVFGQDKYDVLLALVRKIFDERDMFDFTSDWDFILINALHKYFVGGLQEGSLQTKECLDLMLQDMHFEEDDKRRPNVKWVGRILSRIELFGKRREAAGVMYDFSLEKIEKYMRSRGWLKD